MNKSLSRRESNWQHRLYYFCYSWWFAEDRPKWRWLDRKVWRFCNWRGWCTLAFWFTLDKRHQCMYPPACRGRPHRKSEIAGIKKWGLDQRNQHARYGGSAHLANHTQLHPYGRWVSSDEFWVFSCCPGEHRFQDSCLLRIKPPRRISKRP